MCETESVTLQRQGCVIEPVRREARNAHHHCQAECEEHLWPNVAKIANSKQTMASLSRLGCTAQRLDQAAASQQLLIEPARQRTRIQLPGAPNGHSLQRKLSICILVEDKQMPEHICGYCFFGACDQLRRTQDSAIFSPACLADRLQQVDESPSSCLAMVPTSALQGLCKRLELHCRL